MNQVEIEYVMECHVYGKQDKKRTFRFSTEKDLIDFALQSQKDYAIDDAYTEFVIHRSASATAEPERLIVR